MMASYLSPQVDELSNTQIVSLLLGSGTVTILEAYRALLAADFHPVENVEFHWYSAEVSFILSQDILVLRGDWIRPTIGSRPLRIAGGSARL